MHRFPTRILTSLMPLASLATLLAATLPARGDEPGEPPHRVFATSRFSIDEIWSHGRRSVLRPLLEQRGFVQSRVLHQLRRPGAEPVTQPNVPDGIDVRPFHPGRDEEAWLAVNSAAFAHHPEQGGVTLEDLRALEAEPWFAADGFFLAWRGTELLGYHWTKIHPDGNGEVYVLGVSPAAQGLGLGRVLLDVGLRHLAGKGCPEVLLYVDESNTGAMHLYESNGFARFDVDIQWTVQRTSG